MIDSTDRPSSKANYTKFRSPPGFLSHTHLDAPDRTHDARGVFSAGIHLTVAELAAVEAELSELFAAAYPTESRAPHLPLWRHHDGLITLFAKSSRRPRIVNEGYRQVLSAERGSRVRLMCSAKPYSLPERVGVSLYLETVQLIALDARNPRRERQRQEAEALRQAVAVARERAGGA